VSVFTPTIDLTVREADGNPTVPGTRTIVVPNGSLTDDGGGQITLAFGGGGTPGGSDTQVQFNNAGSFGGAAGVTWVPGSSPNLTVTAQASAHTALRVQLAASQSVAGLAVRDNSGNDVYSFGGGTTASTLLTIAVPSGAGGLAGFRLAADGSDRWTFYTAGVNSYAFLVDLFGTGPALTIDTSRNVSLCDSGSFGGGSKVVFIANTTGAPGSNPTGGGILYVEGGALKYRGSGGTVSTVAPA
jgi:hypothetical protein